MAKGYLDMIAAAGSVVQKLTPQELRDLFRDPDAQAVLVLVDIREESEIAAEMMIEGALHAPRGGLEFLIDPTSPQHQRRFAAGDIYVFYCTTGERSLLAARLAQEMGLMARVLDGGLQAWNRDVIVAPKE